MSVSWVAESGRFRGMVLALSDGDFKLIAVAVDNLTDLLDVGSGNKWQSQCLLRAKLTNTVFQIAPRNIIIIKHSYLTCVNTIQKN